MSANNHSKSRLEILLIHKREYMKLSRNKASQYLEQHNFSESEKNAFRKYRRNVQTKICSKKYRNGFKERIKFLEKELEKMRQENLLLKTSKGHIHWKKKILKNF
jgi:hypothetical protein